MLAPPLDAHLFGPRRALLALPGSSLGLGSLGPFGNAPTLAAAAEAAAGAAARVAAEQVLGGPLFLLGADGATNGAVGALSVGAFGDSTNQLAVLADTRPEERPDGPTARLPGVPYRGPGFEHWLSPATACEPLEALGQLDQWGQLGHLGPLEALGSLEPFGSLPRRASSAPAAAASPPRAALALVASEAVESVGPSAALAPSAAHVPSAHVPLSSDGFEQAEGARLYLAAAAPPPAATPGAIESAESTESTDPIEMALSIELTGPSGDDAGERGALGASLGEVVEVGEVGKLDAATLEREAVDRMRARAASLKAADAARGANGDAGVTEGV